MTFQWALNIASFRSIFYVICLVAAGGLSIFWIYQFSLNNDLTLVDYKSYLANEDSVFPVTSLCFVDPITEEKLSQYGHNVTKHEYIEFLLGNSYDKILTTVDYENVSLQLMDFVELLQLFGADGGIPKHNASDGIGVKSIYVSYSGKIKKSVAKCFAFEINDANVQRIRVDMKSDIFPNGIRPPMDKFQIFFHYPKQILLSLRNNKRSWPIRNNNQSYQMRFKIKNVETLKRRYKDGSPCIQNWKRFDDIFTDQKIISTGCKTPFQESSKDLPICNNPEQMRRAALSTSMSNKNEMKNKDLPPCQTMENINYEYREKDVNGEGICWIQILFPNRNFKQITQTREISLFGLIGNVGGFIGICIGYSLLDFFDFVSVSFRHIKDALLKTRMEATTNLHAVERKVAEEREIRHDDDCEKELTKEEIRRIRLLLSYTTSSPEK